MAELVYAFDLKSNGEIRMGSSPISGTKIPELVECHLRDKMPLFTGVILFLQTLFY